jgi:hypothetical protein
MDRVMLTRILAGFLVVLLLSQAGTAYLLVASYKANGAQKAQLEASEQARKRALAASKRDRALSARRAKENAATARENALLRQRVEGALAQHRAWADQPVPKEVQDALQLAP